MISRSFPTFLSSEAPLLNTYALANSFIFDLASLFVSYQHLYLMGHNLEISALPQVSANYR